MFGLFVCLIIFAIIAPCIWALARQIAPEAKWVAVVLTVPLALFFTGVAFILILAHI